MSDHAGSGCPFARCKMRDTAVIVPCYNEAERLDGEAFRGLSRTQGRVYFLYVNDGSTDRTQEVLEDLHRHDPDAFRLLPLEAQLGQGRGSAAGNAAGAGVEAGYIGYWDADLATPLALISDFRRGSGSPTDFGGGPRFAGASSGPRGLSDGPAALSGADVRDRRITGARAERLRHPVRREAVPSVAHDAVSLPGAVPLLLDLRR